MRTDCCRDGAVLQLGADNPTLTLLELASRRRYLTEGVGSRDHMLLVMLAVKIPGAQQQCRRGDDSMS
jgi:hypothetical protein